MIGWKMESWEIPGGGVNVLLMIQTKIQYLHHLLPKCDVAEWLWPTN